MAAKKQSKPKAPRKKKEEEVVELVEPIEEVPEEIIIKSSFDMTTWHPKTEVGKKVKAGDIKRMDDILDHGLIYLEPEIIDILLPETEMDLLLIGQSKGKFGGGQRRVFKQTQKKTQEGNKPKFATLGVVGNKDGYVGVGYGKSKETVPAREKAMRNAKLNMIKIRRGCGSWECNCKEAHSIPFKVTGKCGSVILTLIPAPKGTGLKVEKECQKILRLAGIRDVWSQTLGKTGTKINLVYACVAALKQLSETKIDRALGQELGVLEGRMRRSL